MSVGTCKIRTISVLNSALRRLGSERPSRTPARAGKGWVADGRRRTSGSPAPFRGCRVQTSDPPESAEPLFAIFKVFVLHCLGFRWAPPMIESWPIAAQCGCIALCCVFVICRGQPDHGARAGWETTSSQPVMGDFGSIINTAQELVQHRRARCEPTRARDRASACSFAPIVGASDLACLDVREPSGRQPVPRVLFRMAITLSLFVYRVRSMYLSRSEEKSFSCVVFPGCIFL